MHIFFNYLDSINTKETQSPTALKPKEKKNNVADFNSNQGTKISSMKTNIAINNKLYFYEYIPCKKNSHLSSFGRMCDFILFCFTSFYVYVCSFYINNKKITFVTFMVPLTAPFNL